MLSTPQVFSRFFFLSRKSFSLRLVLSQRYKQLTAVSCNVFKGLFKPLSKCMSVAKEGFLKYFHILHKCTFSTFYSTTTSTNDTMTLQNGTQQDEKDSRLIKLGRTFNNFFFNGKKKNMRDESKSTGVFYDIDQTFLRFLQFLGYRSNLFKPLFCQGHHIGLVAKEVEQELLPYQDVFALHPDKIDLCPGIVGYNEISAKIDLVLRSLRDKNLFQALRGWRNETYDIR